MVKINTSEKALLAFTLAVLTAFARPSIATDCVDGCAGEKCKSSGTPTGSYIDCCNGNNVVTAAKYECKTYDPVFSEDGVYHCVFDANQLNGYCFSLGNFTDKKGADGMNIACTHHIVVQEDTATFGEAPSGGIS